MSMNWVDATKDGDALEDQSDNMFLRDETGFAIYVSGYYTLQELLTKVREVSDANRFY